MDDNLTLEQWYEGLTAREQQLMRRGIRQLLSRTFLIKAQDRELFGFFSRNQDHLESYFAPMGFTMFLEQDYGIAMLRDRQEERVDSRELSAINRKSFTVRESVIYCALAWIFMEKMSGGLDRSILIRPDELTKTLEQFGIGAGFRTEFNKTQIGDALKTLQKYSLVSVQGDLGEEDCALVLYPTLMFGLDLKEMEEFLNRHKDSYQAYYAQAPSDADDDNQAEDETGDDPDAEGMREQETDG